MNEGTCTISISSFIISTMSAMDVLCAVSSSTVRFIVAVRLGEGAEEAEVDGG